MEQRSYRLKGQSNCHSNQVWQCLSSNDSKEIWQKVYCMLRLFGLLIYPDAFLFSCFCWWCGCVELASNITMQHNNLDMRQFCLIWFKTRDKIDICSYPYRKQHFLLSYLKTLNVGPTGVWTHGLLLSSTSSSNWANQVWEKLKQGCYQGSNPGPWAPKAMPPLPLQSLVTLLTDCKMWLAHHIPINWELPQMKGTNWKSSSPHTPWLPAGSILYCICNFLISSKYLERIWSGKNFNGR